MSSINSNDFAMKYAQCGNVYEAAVYAGATRAAAAIEGVRLLFNRGVRSKISRLRLQRAACPSAQGMRRIAFGRNNDAVRLAFAENVTPEMIEQADLYGVSEIKCGKGVVEIKFFDRLKALDLLYQAEREENSETSAETLIGAIYGKGKEGDF